MDMGIYAQKESKLKMKRIVHQPGVPASNASRGASSMTSSYTIFVLIVAVIMQLHSILDLLIQQHT